MNLRERTFELLKGNPEQRFKAREIAEWIHRTYPHETREKIARSSFLDSEAGLLSQVVAEIGANRPAWQAKFPNLRTTEGRPRKYYWTEKSEAEEVSEAEDAGGAKTSSVVSVIGDPDKRLLERDLYPMLID